MKLQKRELGPHAHEDRVPARIEDLLKEDGRSNVCSDVIPKLTQLLEHDSNLEVAYLCSSDVKQISKLKREGAHFCGYRNIQMLCRTLGYHDRIALPVHVGILELQDLVEKAWDDGFNAHGRIETGGVKGTRKHIGTSEAEALLLSLGVPCTGNAFKGKKAWKQLLDFVEAHFRMWTPGLVETKVVQTSSYPIFLQRPKHSLTIVGLERIKSGKRRLLTFDPAWQPPSKMQTSFDAGDLSIVSTKLLLQRYRKNQQYLKRFNAFETLNIDKPD